MWSRTDCQPLTGARRSRGSPHRAAVPALVGALVLCTGSLTADGGPGPLAVAPLNDDDRLLEVPLPPVDQVERRRVATAMVYLVVGIGVGGIALIVLIVLGGHRLRQRVRSRTGPSPDLDPLWYLRSSEKHRGTAREPVAEERATSEEDDREGES